MCVGVCVCVSVCVSVWLGGWVCVWVIFTLGGFRTVFMVLFITAYDWLNQGVWDLTS